MYQLINCLCLVILKSKTEGLLWSSFLGRKMLKSLPLGIDSQSMLLIKHLSLRNFNGNSVKTDRLWSLCTAVFKDSQCLTVPHRLHFKERPSSFEGALLLFGDFAQLLMLLLWLGSKSHPFSSLYNFPLKFLKHLLFWSLHPSTEELESVKHSEIN